MKSFYSETSQNRVTFNSHWFYTIYCIVYYIIYYLIYYIIYYIILCISQYKKKKIPQIFSSFSYILEIQDTLLPSNTKAMKTHLRDSIFRTFLEA